MRIRGVEARRVPFHHPHLPVVTNRYFPESGEPVAVACNPGMM